MCQSVLLANAIGQNIKRLTVDSTSYQSLYVGSNGEAIYNAYDFSIDILLFVFIYIYKVGYRQNNNQYNG